MLSVLISVFNGSAYLAEAMDSLLNQTYRDYEMIVVDDGSTDDTLDLLQAYAAKDARINIVHHSNRGVPASLNAAARLATGKYLARMDLDDVSMLTRFEKQIAYMEEHPEVDVLGSRVILIDPFGTEYYRPLHALSHDEIDARLLNGEGWAVVQPAAMIRHTAFLAVKGYDERYRTSQDFDLWLRMAERGRLENLEEPLLKYRQHLRSANFAKAQQQKELKIQILKEAYARRGLPSFDAAALPPAPETDPFRIRKRWGWAAIRAGRFDAARRHACANLKTHPMDCDAWRMLYCSVRGH